MTVQADAKETEAERMARWRDRLRAVMFTTEPRKGDLPWKPGRRDLSGQEVCPCDLCTMQDGL